MTVLLTDILSAQQGLPGQSGTIFTQAVIAQVWPTRQPGARSCHPTQDAEDIQVCLAERKDLRDGHCPLSAPCSSHHWGERSWTVSNQASSRGYGVRIPGKRGPLKCALPEDGRGKSKLEGTKWFCRAGPIRKEGPLWVTRSRLPRLTKLCQGIGPYESSFHPPFAHS